MIDGLVQIKLQITMHASTKKSKSKVQTLQRLVTDAVPQNWKLISKALHHIL